MKSRFKLFHRDREFLDITLGVVLGLVLFALVSLAGCGGGGGSTVASTSGLNWEFQFSANAPALVQTGPGAFKFTFPTADGVHYLVTPAAGTARSGITAHVSVETTGAPTFDYHTNPDNTCATPANFRLYFQRDNDLGPYVNAQGYEFYRWWNVKGVTLAPGSAILTADLTNPADWTSVFGKSGTQAPAEFAAAVREMRNVGVTFGGGCFYGHGVFVDPGTGSATFNLLRFDLT